MHRHEGASERRLLELIHDHTHRIAERLELVFQRQHTIFKELRAMSASTQAQLDALTAGVADAVATFQTVATGIDKEIQQLVDALAGGPGGGVTPAMSAQLQASIDGLTALRTSMGAAATRLGGDDGTGGTGTGPGPSNVDPTAFAAAIADARAQGATDVQLQVITVLGTGVSPQITKQMLQDALAAALVAASDGSTAATAAQLASLSALAA